MVITAVLTAVISNPIDSLFGIMMAPTADAAKLNAAESLVMGTGRIMSNAALQGIANLTKRETTRRVAGVAARLIPDKTKEAHEFASASLEFIRSASGSHSSCFCLTI